MMCSPRSGPFLIGGAAVLSISAAMSLEITPRLVWNATPSAPQGLYFIADKTPETSDYVLIEPSLATKTLIAERHYLPPDIPMIKRVTALPGAEICRVNAQILINGVHVADALEVDSSSRKMPHWSGCFTLQGSDFFLLNDHERSLDGRYFGATKKSQIIGVARPILIRDSDK